MSGCPALQPGPFRLRLLDPVLAEAAMAGGDHGPDPVERLDLGDGNQRHLVAPAPGAGGGSGDPGFDVVERHGWGLAEDAETSRWHRARKGLLDAERQATGPRK